MNKTKTNTELSGVVSFKQLRALSDILSHQCVLLQTHK